MARSMQIAQWLSHSGKVYVLGIFFSIGFCKTLWPYDNVDSLFYRGVAVYQRGRYAESLRIFENLDRTFPQHPRITASLLMQGKALYKLGEFQHARETFLELIQFYPQSSYVDDAMYGLALVAYRENNVKEAITHLLAVSARGGDKPLVEKAERLAVDMMKAFLNSYEQKEFIEKLSDEKSKGFVALHWAQREFQEKHYASVRAFLDEFLRLYPRNPYASALEKIRNRAEDLGKGIVKIGVILPLTGKLSEQGKMLLDGIQYGIEVYNQTSSLKVELLIKDSQGNAIEAIKCAQWMTRQQEIVAIIGDLESQVTEAVAGVTQENQMSLIAPTAMEEGIASIGPYVFQLNGSLSVRIKVLAEYAISALGMKRFALLCPMDEVGWIIRNAFVSTVTALGGEILVEKWYRENIEDLSLQMRGVREVGLMWMVQDSLLSAQGGKMDEFRKSFVERKVTRLLDQNEIPVTSIDGFLIIPTRENMSSILAQLRFLNLKTFILGNSVWDNPSFLKEHHLELEELQGLIFYSDFYEDPYNPALSAFRSGYQKVTGKIPGKMEAIGYDAIRVILEAMGERSISRTELRDRLAQLSSYQGVRGPISFTGGRVNPAFRLIQFREGKHILIR